MSHSERNRKRVLRLKRHLANQMSQSDPRRASLEAEYKRLVTGKKAPLPVGTTVGVKQVRRRK